jgi:hypothetical protein
VAIACAERAARWCLVALLGCGVANAGDLTTWTGVYVRGHEVRDFVPCGDHASYWLIAAEEPERRLAAFVAEHGRGAYPAVYLVFDGASDPAARPGFATGHDGVLRVTRILGMAPTIPADCAWGGK